MGPTLILEEISGILFELLIGKKEAFGEKTEENF